MANQLLLVDDSPLIHRVVELTFEGQDFSIHAAETPEQAFALARTVKPDIVVASAEMKGAGGVEICQRLRQEGELGETPVLLLTSARGGVSEGEARQAGAAGVLVKPFEPERLLAEVSRVLARTGLDKDGDATGVGASEPPEQESPSGHDLFDDHELESLFASGEENPAELPPQAQDDSDLLHQAEKVLDEDETGSGEGAPAAPSEGEQDVRLFEDTELDDLFAEEIEGTAEATSPPPAAVQPGEDWADLDLEDDIVVKPPEVHGDLADLANAQSTAAEAQLAEFEVETASGGAHAEDDVSAAESQIQNLQEELSRELAGAADIQMPKSPAAPPAAPSQPESDDDLLGLAAEAGFGDPSPKQPEAGAVDELDLEVELSASGMAEPGGFSPTGEDSGLDELMEASYNLPTEEETPVWDIPLKRQDEAHAAEETEAGAPGSAGEDVEPLVQKSLERTVEAIVPALIRNIEALVVKQLPDLVEKIVLREIEKIKRGE